MSSDYIDYAAIVDDAMHYVVRRALELVDEHGLQGDHHFYITFRTQHPEVMISDDLLARYPEEMTIVLQHQFWDLEVETNRFSLVLSFNNIKQSLTVPFDALVSFADPSVRFGLQFTHSNKEDLLLDSDDAIDAALNHQADSDDEAENGASDNVVVLDNFRKK